MRNITLSVLAFSFLLVAHSFAAEETHPLKKLAAAEADAEIALKEARELAGKFERAYDTRRERLNRQPDTVRRVVQEARRKEEAKADDARSPLVFEACDDASRAIEDLWSDQQEGLRELDAVGRKLRERLDNLQESFQHARQLAEHWKRADMPLDSLAPVFAALAAEAKAIGEQFPKVESDLDKRMDDWSKQAATTRDKLGVK